ncbi:hypothetical protein FAES_1685 [Fibrella aestuarina BUZ 2]|uniref:YdhG-like domain-containing protein n=1 Tax=Fibrella aestuarina BUZ 2 TaxID=1166018 RepID=I0K6E2_9BACT|nr:DUF1801 domain-containing protein [Fibrella aestuarina]CCG99695.1 hypothetical protein FAES_1685 [Fibrella aestuarina BUZ 2]
MNAAQSTPTTIDDYIATFPAAVQSLLTQVRATIREAAPEATETIKYAMPTYVLDGNLVYFAAFAKHIGFYATPSGQEAFRERLAGYKTGKGSIQFPFDKPIPHDLIRDMVRYRVAENRAKAAAKRQQKATIS